MCMTLCVTVVGLSDTVKQLLQVLEEKMRELVTINDQVLIHLLPPLQAISPFMKENGGKKLLMLFCIIDDGKS